MKLNNCSFRRAVDKILSRSELSEVLDRLKQSGLRIVFTNGCFDLLHPGHIRYLERAKSLGDKLVIALNSDDSVRRLKGSRRPINILLHRAEVIAALHCVDFVTSFDEDTPFQIINELKPDILVKGGDWPKDQIVGRDIVEENGGQVHVIEFEKGYSTTRIIERIRSLDQI